MRHKGKQLALGHKDKEGLGVGIRSHVDWFPGAASKPLCVSSHCPTTLYEEPMLRRRHSLPKDIHLVSGNILQVWSGNTVVVFDLSGGPKVKTNLKIILRCHLSFSLFHISIQWSFPEVL